MCNKSNKKAIKLLQDTGWWYSVIISTALSK